MSLLGAYLDRGWLVLPLHTPNGQGGCSCGNPQCESPGKHPRTARGLKDASLLRATVRGWWKQWPDANIGIVTGGSAKLLVLDVDARHGGLATLEALEAMHGKLPPTPTVRTGSGGMHFYLRTSERHQNSAGKLGPGLDTRADGGYVVAAPSVHVSGQKYYWLDGCSPSDLAVADAPAWLTGLLLGLAPNDGPRERFDTAAALAGVPEGQREVTIFRLACKLRSADVPQDVAGRLVLETAGNCIPPFPEAACIRQPKVGSPALLLRRFGR